MAPDKKAWLWDAETGERFLYPTDGKNNRLKITLGPAETKLIVFDAHTQGEKYRLLDFSKKPVLIITTPWSLTLNHVNGDKSRQKLNTLVDFKDDNTLAAFAGTAVYENSFELNNQVGINYLNLGKVVGVSEVMLNGKNLGNRWYGDHVYPVKDALIKGENTLSIKLTTTLGNYMHSLTDNKETIKWIKGRNQPIHSMGILGPVEIG